MATIQTPGPQEPPTTTAEQERAVMVLAPEVAAESLGDYFRAWWIRIKGGESGALPVLVGIIAIGVIFQTQNSHFLTAGNLTNLLVQGAAVMLLGMGETFALLLGEIDLSIGWVSGIAAVIMTELLIEPRGWPTGAAIVLALLATTAIGLLQGTIIAKLRVPSFVVTLAGMLGWQGVMIMILGAGGTILIPNDFVNDIAGGNLNATASWIVMVVLVGGYAGLTLWRDGRRRSNGLTAPPPGLTLLKIAFVAAAGVVLVLICNTNRNPIPGHSLRGVPWAVPVVLGVLAMWTFLLHRMRFGRYMYAVGGNAEAARRAGVSLDRIRIAAFALAGLTAGVAGIVYASRLQSVSTSLDQSLVLYAVAAAVIGGTSLFGGRGKMVNAILGGFVIAAITNGMGLLGKSAAAQYVVTALVLLAAATVDALARRGKVGGGVMNR
jgi:D-xylose transport system permease protein